MAKNKTHIFKIKPNGKFDTGAPTKYLPDYCKDIIAFFENAPKTQRIIKSESTGKNDFKKIEYETIACELPTIAKYARKIGVNKSTIYEWAKEHKEFSNALTEVSELYKEFLNDNGLRGYYNPLYAKFVAINTTDMKDKQETDMNIVTYEAIKNQKDKYGFGK